MSSAGVCSSCMHACPLVTCVTAVFGIMVRRLCVCSVWGGCS